MLSRQVPNGDAAGVGTPVQRHLLRPAPAHLDVKQALPALPAGGKARPILRQLGLQIEQARPQLQAQ